MSGKTLRADLKALREKKRSIAARFKAAETPADLVGLKDEMRRVSSELKALEGLARAAEGQRLERLADGEPQNAPEQALPARFRGERRRGGDAAALSFEPLRADNRAEWDEFVAGMPDSTLYHDSRWLDVMTHAMRRRSLSLLARAASGRVVGILPLYRLTSRLFGDYAVSMPYLNYGGALGVNDEIEEALMREAGRMAESLRLDHVEFRDLVERDGWPGRGHKVSMVLPMPDSDEALDRELGTKLRAQIRRARREPVEIEHGQSGAHLRAFYAVFARNMRDLGTPVYGRALFEQVMRRFPDEASVLIVKLEGRAVGGAFLLRHRDVMEVPWASTIRRFNSLGINMLMYREALGIAIRHGCRHFDFGRSSPDSGAYRFKRQWGAEPVRHHWHYWLPEGRPVPALDPDNPRYRALIAVWRRLPVPVTRWIGPPIVRNLP